MTFGAVADAFSVVGTLRPQEVQLAVLMDSNGDGDFSTSLATVPLPTPPLMLIGAVLAAALFALQLLLLLRFHASVRAFQRGCATGEWALPAAAARGEARAILPRQLALRV
eukprot:4792895-Prymnesium_polylepis.1